MSALLTVFFQADSADIIFYDDMIHQPSTREHTYLVTRKFTLLN